MGRKEQEGDDGGGGDETINLGSWSWRSTRGKKGRNFEGGDCSRDTGEDGDLEERVTIR